MCAWGLAWALGPFINHPVLANSTTVPNSTPFALAAAQRAVALAAASPMALTTKERGLIDAMSVRYPLDPFADQTPGYRAYRDKLAALAQAFPQDEDIVSLFAESVMLLRCNSKGYDFLGPDGMSWPDIAAAAALLETVLKRGTHPFARHLFIHITEPSSQNGKEGAARAQAAANALFAQVRGHYTRWLMCGLVLHVRLVLCVV